MGIIYRLCGALSVGVIIGFLAGIPKMIKKPDYTEKQKEAQGKLYRRMAAVLEYVTFLLLILGFIWCIYYLVMGAMDPAQAEYATNMSQLIVSVLTIISIAFAFFEFLKAGPRK